MEHTPEMNGEIAAFISGEQKELTGRILPGLRILYAVSRGYPDQYLRQNVPDAAPGAVTGMADAGNAGGNEEDRGMSGLRAVYGKMSL